MAGRQGLDGTGQIQGLDPIPWALEAIGRYQMENGETKFV